MKIVPEWRQAHKWLSMRLSALGAALALGWTALSPVQQTDVLDFIGLPPGAIAAILFLAVAIGRLTAQPDLHE